MALTFSYSQNIWMGSDGGSGLSATDSVSRAKKWTKARAAIAGGNMLGGRHCSEQENLKISEVFIFSPLSKAATPTRHLC